MKPVPTEKRKGNYTMADIAARMGISPTAVSMALRNSGGVSDQLRQKILKVVEEINYTPALAARMLRAKNTGQLGLYLPVEKVEQVEMSGGFIMPVMAHFVDQCEVNKYSYHIEFEQRSLPFVPPLQLTGRIVDGLLLVGAQRPELLEWLNEHPEYKWVSVIEKETFCVLSNNRTGVYRAVEYLAAMGHRKIAFAHCDIDYAAHATALAGYHEGIKDFALCSEDFLIHEFKGRKGEMAFDQINQWCDYILNHPKRPTAIICNDQKIVNVLMTNAAYKGIRIPEQLSLISYGVKSGAESVYPKTTAIEPDFSRIIEKSTRMLIKRINNEDISSPQIFIDPKLVKRDSVASPAAQT